MALDLKSIFNPSNEAAAPKKNTAMTAAHDRLLLSEPRYVIRAEVANQIAAGRMKSATTPLGTVIPVATRTQREKMYHTAPTPNITVYRTDSCESGPRRRQLRQRMAIKRNVTDAVHPLYCDVAYRTRHNSSSPLRQNCVPRLLRPKQDVKKVFSSSFPHASGLPCYSSAYTNSQLVHPWSTRQPTTHPQRHRRGGSMGRRHVPSAPSHCIKRLIERVHECSDRHPPPPLARSHYAARPTPSIDPNRRVDQASSQRASHKRLPGRAPHLKIIPTAPWRRDSRRPASTRRRRLPRQLNYFARTLNRPARLSPTSPRPRRTNQKTPDVFDHHSSIAHRETAPIDHSATDPQIANS